MSEVSCRAFSFFTAADARGLISLDRLLDGFPFSRRYLATASNRVPWDAWAELCERFAAQVGSDEKVIASGEFVLSEGFRGYLGRALGLLADPRELYEMGSTWVGPSLYRSLVFEAVSPGPPRRLRFSVRLKPGYRGSAPWFMMAQGSLATMPRFMGLPDALVELVERTDRSVVANLTLPPAPGLRSFVRRATALLTTPGAIVQELSEQQAQLSMAFDEMRKSNRAFRNTLDALPYLIAVHDKGLPSGGTAARPRPDLARLLYVNPAFGAFFGQAPSSLVGVELASLFPASDRARLGHWLDPTPHRVLLQREGTEFELEVSGFDSIEFGGQEAAIFHARDLTEAREAKAKAERTEQAMLGVLDAFPDLVLRFDASNVLRSVHGAGAAEVDLLRARIGQHAKEVVQLFTWVDPAVSAQALADFEEAVTQRKLLTRTLSLPGPAGGMRDLLVRFAPIGAELAIIVHDETERRAVARRLQVAERMASLGSLAAGIAHEINNPLTWVLTNLDVLEAQLRQGSAGPEAVEILGEIRDGARRIRDTVLGMKDFSRVSKREPGRVDLRRVIERAGRMVQHELKHCASLRLDLTPCPPVLADETELGQVFVNLLVNAAQAMPPGATPQTHTIIVALKAADGRVVASVEDPGVGIPPDVARRLFEPFVTTKTQGQGTGLGLAISQRIIQEAGGRISVESRPGRTVFTIDLPAAAEGVEAAPAVVANVPVRKLRVVVIDDEPFVTRGLGRALAGHQVTAFSSAAEGLAHLVEGPLPDVVLCDVMMPGLNGIDVVEKLSAVRPDFLPRVILMTGGGLTPRVERLLETSPCRVLRKPFEPGALEALLAELAG